VTARPRFPDGVLDAFWALRRRAARPTTRAALDELFLRDLTRFAVTGASFSSGTRRSPVSAPAGRIPTRKVAEL